MLFYTSPVAYFSLNCTETCSEHPRDTKETYHYCAFVFFQSRRALETEPLLHRTPPLARSPPQAGRLSVSPTRFSGRCTSSSLLLSWRSAFSFGFIFRAFIQLFAECRCWASSPVCSGTTLCSGTSWVFGGCSRSCSTAGLYRCRGNTSSPARQMLLSGDYATTWPSWSTTCSITYR